MRMLYLFIILRVRSVCYVLWIFFTNTPVSICAHNVGDYSEKCPRVGIGFNEAEPKSGITHI